MKVPKIGEVWMVPLCSAALALTLASNSIRFDSQSYEKPLTRTTRHLLSSFDRCIVFIFDWAFKSDYDSWTPTTYFASFSDSLNCAVVVDSYTQFHKSSYLNPRFAYASRIWKPHPLFTKNTITLINIYSDAATLTAINNGNAPDADVDTILLRYNIPFNYILLFMNSSQFSSVNGRKFIDFAIAPVPAAYVVILDAKEVYVIGLAQAVGSTPYLFRIGHPHATQIQRIHRAIHKDLQRASLDVHLSQPRQFCTSASNQTITANECIVNLVVEHFNLTFCDYYNDPCLGNTIGSIFPAAGITNSKLFTRNEDWKLDLINYAAHYSESKFICLVETDTIGLRAFVHAYGLPAWTVTVAACVFMTTTIAAMSFQVPNSPWTKSQESAVVVLMLLIDRFYKHSQVIRSGNRQTLVVIALWAFGASLLGMCYSGNLVSELTSPSLPALPRDMQELSHMEYPIFTSTLRGVLINSTLHKMPYLLSDIDRYLTNLGGHGGTLASTLRRLRKAVIFKTSIASIDSAGNRMSSRILYAYADTTYAAKAHEIRSTKDGRRRRALYGGDLPFFNHPTYVAVVSNFLSPAFHWFFAALFDSGVYNLWQNLISAKYVAYTASQGTGLGKMWRRKIRQAAIWQDFDPLLKDGTSWNAISFGNLDAVFKFLGIGALLSLFIMINERCPFWVVWRVLISKANLIATATYRIHRNLALLLRTWALTIRRRVAAR